MSRDDRIDVGLMPNSSTPPKGFEGWPKPPRRLRWQYLFLMALISTALLVAIPYVARAEGETVQVVHQDCKGVTVGGSGYTPGQTLLIFARAPQGEGTITEQVEVKANGEGIIPLPTLEFGGQVPDGTYQVVVTTPGPGQREEVTTSFQVRGCLAGERRVSATADCKNVTVAGTGFEQTNATVEAVVLGEGEMVKQVFPDAQGRFTASIPWSSPPIGGQRTVEARIDNVKRAEANFQAPNCSVLPFTGPPLTNVQWGLFGAIMILTGVVVLLLTRRIQRN